MPTTLPEAKLHLTRSFSCPITSDSCSPCDSCCSILDLTHIPPFFGLFRANITAHKQSKLPLALMFVVVWNHKNRWHSHRICRIVYLSSVLYSVVKFILFPDWKTKNLLPLDSGNNLYVCFVRFLWGPSSLQACPNFKIIIFTYHTLHDFILNAPAGAWLEQNQSDQLS